MTDPQGPQEHRRAKRIARKFVLRVALFSKEPLAWSYVTIRNLSSSGIFFSYDRPIEMGQSLVFKIDFPDRILECVGRVTRVEHGPAGLYTNVAATFQGMDDAQQRYIETFVQSWRPGE